MAGFGELWGALPPSIFGIFGAIVGGLITGYFNLRNMRARNNYSLLASTTQNSDQIRAYATVYKFLASHSGIEEIPIERVRAVDKLDENLVILFTMYQYIAHAVKIGMLDKDVVLTDSYAAMRLMGKRFGPFIEHYRVALGRPALWGEYVSFVQDNAARYEKISRKSARSRWLSQEGQLSSKL